MPEFARFSTFRVDPGKVDDAVAFFNGRDLADASAVPGFRRGFWLLDRQTGRGVELVVFRDRDSLQDSDEEEGDARRDAERAGIAFGSAEVYEVVAEGRPPN
jgi:hypothetical protein